MIEGGCLCGAVRWTYDGTFSAMTHCHCGMCRKAHGSAFATYAVGPYAGYTLTRGGADKCTRESSPGFIRAFCRHCGSILPNSDLGDIIAIPAGGIDGDPGIAATGHIFVRWKAPWHTITDGLPRHDNYPGVAVPAVARTAAPASSDGKRRGSCLCGAVAYVLDGSFTRVHHCHCSRCRRARAAAHSTNGFVARGDLAFTRGEERVVMWRQPDAAHFAQSFCRDCGAAVPHVIAAFDSAIVPFGSLDDDPGRLAERHVFVDSGANWYPITDDLPQFSGAAAD